MMNFLKSAILVFLALSLFGCGGDAPEPTAKKEAMPASADTAASSEMGSGTIDHSRDEAEFELRRSINGIDRMIEQYTADGYETGELEAQKAEISANLDALLNG